MSAAPPALAAYVSTSREIRLLDGLGGDRPLSAPRVDVLWGAWATAAPKPDAWSWPTWSPDGRRIACFRLPPNDGGTAALVSMDIDGISSVELAELDGRIPIYLFWSPGGRRVALLTQQADLLRLSTASLDDAGVERELAQGSPLFFTWAGEDRVAAFVGSPTGSRPRLSVLDASGHAAARRLPGVPGNFCAPLWLDGRVVYVLHQGTSTRVVSALVDADAPDRIEEVDGLVAMVAAPDGRSLARAVAPGGDGTPYRNIAIIDVATGAVREVIDTPCLAFVWSPRGDRLVVARVDTRRNLLEWLRVDLDGRIEHLADMYPTRDLGFYLRFFEQYSQSHPLIDATGTRLMLAGTLLGRGPGRANPKVWDIGLDDGTTRDVGDGVFGVFAPPVLGGAR